MSDTQIKSGEFRTKVYRVFEKAMGRVMTDTEHADLRAVLIEYGSQAKPQTERVQHEFVCGKCGGKKVGKGKVFKKNMLKRYESKENKG